MPTIAEKYGPAGKRALLYLDKIKMLESQWITTYAIIIPFNIDKIEESTLMQYYKTFKVYLKI